MSYQSLYRRYRSQTFAEIKGQQNVTTALRSAVKEGRHGHAYLFSGPRGTGKTSTARVLAKALNCENLSDGEPCGVCASCKSIEQGKSFDIHELDAASNNKVDDMRELIAKVHLGSPGRTKVYILDEVHMLSTGAENALLKTLEEPPEHVVFVLATTEPHKVVPTIRSRTQHFKFSLLSAAELEEHIRWIADDAGFSVDAEIVEYVIAQGGGSARDTLSALDLVLAAGGLPEGSEAGEEIIQALADQDAQAVIHAVQKGISQGKEPRIIGEDLLDLLRNSFLAAMGTPLGHVSEATQLKSKKFADALTVRALTAALETVGAALVDMRQAADPRVPLEVALLRLCRQVSDPSDLLARIEVLEEQVEELRNSKSEMAVSSPVPVVATVIEEKKEEAPPASVPTPDRPVVASSEKSDTSALPASPRSRNPAAAARQKLASAQKETPVSPVEAPVVEVVEEKVEIPPEIVSSASMDRASCSLQDAEAAVEECLDQLSQKIRVRFRGGTLLSFAEGKATFGVPNAIHQSRCEDVKESLETALSKKLGQPIAIAVVVKQEEKQEQAVTTPNTPEYENYSEEISSINELDDATGQSSNTIDRITKAFPGSKVVES